MKFKITRESWIQNLFGVENNQVLIRVYELLDADFKKLIRLRIDEEGRNIGTSFLFVNRLHMPDDTNTYEFNDICTLKEYLYIY